MTHSGKWGQLQLCDTEQPAWLWDDSYGTVHLFSSVHSEKTGSHFCCCCCFVFCCGLTFPSRQAHHWMFIHFMTNYINWEIYYPPQLLKKFFFFLNVYMHRCIGFSLFIGQKIAQHVAFCDFCVGQGLWDSLTSWLFRLVTHSRGDCLPNRFHHGHSVEVIALSVLTVAMTIQCLSLALHKTDADPLT